MYMTELIETKINELTIVSEENKALLIQGSQFTQVPYFPLTTEFVGKYVLNASEYPSDEGKFIQASTELKSRLNQLFQANYDYKKNLIELEKLELDIEEIEESSKSTKRIAVEVAEKELEMAAKNWALRNIKENAENLFNEYKTWLSVVNQMSGKLQDKYPDAQSWKDFDLNEARMIDIRAKMQQWKILSAHGQELNQSQINLLVSEQLDNAQKK
jgi:hypothetical protein